MVWRPEKVAISPLKPEMDSRESLIDMYRMLWRIRTFEDQVRRLAAAGEVPGFPHFRPVRKPSRSVFAHILSREDLLFTSHRGHGHTSPRAAICRPMFAEILGRETACVAVAADRCTW